MHNEAHELTEELKTHFLRKHYFFEYIGQAWTKANDVARFLDLKDAQNMVYHHISATDKIMFKQFPHNIQKSIISGIGYRITNSIRDNMPDQDSMVRNKIPDSNCNIHPETMFINEEGVFELFMKSHKPIAKAMKRWLVYDVIPAIIKTGTYSVVPIPIAQSPIQTITAVAEPRSTVCHNPHDFPISSMKSAIYILQLPLLNMYKFGYSNNVINRLKQHESDFSEITIQLVIEVPDAQEIERRLKTEIRSHGINTVYEIDGRKLKELFIPEHFDKVCEIVHEIVNNYTTDSFTNIQNHEYRMACEVSKQKDKEIEMKQKEIEMKQKEIEMKDQEIEITMEHSKQKQYEIEILKLQIELEKETRKRKIEAML